MRQAIQRRTQQVNERVHHQQQIAQSVAAVAATEEEEPLDQSGVWPPADLIKFNSILQTLRPNPIDAFGCFSSDQWAEIANQMERSPEECKVQFARLVHASYPACPREINPRPPFSIAFYSNPVIHHAQQNSTDWFEYFSRCGYHPQWWNVNTSQPSAYPGPTQSEPHDIAVILRYDGTFGELVQITDWLKVVAFRRPETQQYLEPELRTGIIFWFRDDQITILEKLMREFDESHRSPTLDGQQNKTDPTPFHTPLLVPTTLRKMAGSYNHQTTDTNGVVDSHKLNSRQELDPFLVTTLVYVTDPNLLPFLRLVAQMNTMMALSS